MFSGKGGLGGFMKQAQQMQEKMQQIQQEVGKLEVTGESGAGVVKVTLDGTYKCLRVNIDPSVYQDDKDLLEDLIAAAFCDAVRRVGELQKEKMAAVSNEIPLPLGLKMPF